MILSSLLFSFFFWCSRLDDVFRTNWSNCPSSNRLLSSLTSTCPNINGHFQSVFFNHNSRRYMNHYNRSLQFFIFLSSSEHHFFSETVLFSFYLTAVSPSTSVYTSNNNNNNNNNSTVPVDFLYMTEKHRIFNVTFGVMNKDTPVCSPIDYVYTVSVPTIWSVRSIFHWIQLHFVTNSLHFQLKFWIFTIDSDCSCEPPLTLYLMPQQFCTIECQFSLNEEETNDFDAMKMTDIVFQINGTSSFPSELHHQVNFVRATWPQICQR